jgi:hypothetical protein
MMSKVSPGRDDETTNHNGELTMKKVNFKSCLKGFSFVTALTVFVCLSTSICFAEPTTEPAYLHSVRPYMDPNAAVVILQLKEVSLCDTDFYYIKVSDPGAKEATSAALAALLGHRRVMLEISNAEGCKKGPAGVRLQSVYLLAD